MFTKKELQNNEDLPDSCDLLDTVYNLHVEYEVELIKAGVLLKARHSYTYIRGYRDESHDLLQEIVKQLKTIFPDSLVLLEDKIENEEMQLDSQICKFYDIECGEYIPCKRYIVVCWADEDSEKKINKELQSLYGDLDEASEIVNTITKKIDETKFKIYKKL